MMQRSAERETTLLWRVAGSFTEPFLVVGVLYLVLSAITSSTVFFWLFVVVVSLFSVLARVHQKYANFANPTFD